jgi:hypothetical protein
LPLLTQICRACAALGASFSACVGTGLGPVGAALGAVLPAVGARLGAVGAALTLLDGVGAVGAALRTVNLLCAALARS